MNPLRPFLSLGKSHRRGRPGAVVLLLVVTLTARLAAVERTYPTLSLKDGRQLSAVKIINYTTTDVLVRHEGGATSLSTELLPASVLTELHLPAPQPTAVPALDPAFVALANKVAVADPTGASTAHRSTESESPVAPEQGRNATASASRALAADRSSPVDRSLLEPAAARKSGPVTFTGRVAVTLPTGETHLLGDVEVRAYPADLLTRYLAQARAKSAELAQQLRQEASVAAQEGRSADSAALTARAKRTADQYLTFLPTTPHTARSDAYGYFTLCHDLRDLRLVAVGRINVARGEWNYAWIGLAPGEDSLLTEANATLVSAPGPAGTRFAAR